MSDFEVARIHHVQLALPRGGEESARGFWCGLLGWTEVPKPPALAVRGGCWFRAGRGDPVEVHVAVEEPFAPARKAHPGIAIDGIDALAARLSAAGREVRWSEEIPETRRFHTDDPFGNRLEFIDAAGLA